MTINKVSILIAEDEPKMRELMTLYLTRENFNVIAVENGLEALRIIERGAEFSLFILDVMMPKMDGFALCKEIRNHSEQPVIFVTARGEEYERLLGFQIGADDYIVKPFSPKELVARVKAVLKRTGALQEADRLLQAAGLSIDVSGRQVILDGELIYLTPKEFDLLVYLLQNKGRALSREQIMERVWDFEYEGDQRTVDTHIKKLREKLGDRNERFIKTVWGVGYKFEVI